MALQNTDGAIPACSLPPCVDLTPEPSVLNLITDMEVTDTLHIPERVNIILATNGILMIYKMIAKYLSESVYKKNYVGCKYAH